MGALLYKIRRAIITPICAVKKLKLWCSYIPVLFLFWAHASIALPQALVVDWEPLPILLNKLWVQVMYVELLIIDGKPSRALHFFQLQETFQVMAVDQPGSSGITIQTQRPRDSCQLGLDRQVEGTKYQPLCQPLKCRGWLWFWHSLYYPNWYIILKVGTKGKMMV